MITKAIINTFNVATWAYNNNSNLTNIIVPFTFSPTHTELKGIRPLAAALRSKLSIINLFATIDGLRNVVGYATSGGCLRAINVQKPMGSETLKGLGA